MTGLIPENELSRRSFLKRGGALVVGFSLGGSLLAGKASATVPTGAMTGYLPDSTQVDSWLSVLPDNSVVFKTSQIDVGNGVTTGLAQIVAEELDADVNMVRHVPWDSWNMVNSGSTGGSTGIQSSAGPPIRSAAATARQALLNMASTSLGVPVASLSVSNGTISGGGKSITYGQLVGGKLISAKIATANLNPGQGISKPVGSYKVVTTFVPRIDIPAKAAGTYTYVHNIRIPGMWHARVVRPRGQGPFGTGAPIVSIDPASISHIPGAQVVRQGDFLAVAAPLEFDAIQAAATLKVTWKDTAGLPTPGNLWKQMRAQDSAGLAKAVFTVNNGDVEAGLKAAATTVSSTYNYQNGTRGVIGPACAVADVHASSATIWTSSQAPLTVVTTIAGQLNIPAQNVRVYWYEGSSSYGSAQSSSDTVRAAALISQLSGKPIRLQFMRWDEHGWDNYQSAQLMDVRGGVDASGKLTAYDYTLMQSPYSTVIDLTSELTGSPYPTTMTGARSDDPSCGVMYFCANKRITGKTMPVYQGYFRAGSLRSGGEGQLEAFAAEGLIDELAFKAGMDPIAFRRLNVSDSRWLGVLNAAAQAANWQPRVANSVKQTGNVVTGRGYGSGTHGTAAYAGAVAEIQVNKKTGKILVTHLYNAMDAGLTVNPDGVENQMTGGSMFGLSRILEGVNFNTKRVTSLDWVTYPILRFKDAPKVTNVLIQRTDQLPLGTGEPTVVPVPAAVANAFFDATGVRLRSGPFTPAVVRATLKAAGVV
jgi:CO/xanthine dehydrogenase Mo-binding subunit